MPYFGVYDKNNCNLLLTKKTIHSNLKNAQNLESTEQELAAYLQDKVEPKDEQVMLT